VRDVCLTALVASGTQCSSSVYKARQLSPVTMLRSAIRSVLFHNLVSYPGAE